MKSSFSQTVKSELLYSYFTHLVFTYGEKVTFSQIILVSLFLTKFPWNQLFAKEFYRKLISRIFFKGDKFFFSTQLRGSAQSAHLSVVTVWKNAIFSSNQFLVKFTSKTLVWRKICEKAVPWQLNSVIFTSKKVDFTEFLHNWEIFREIN